VDDNGCSPEYARQYRINEKHLANLQNKQSKRVKRSSNYKKGKQKIAKLHERIGNCRKDFIEKLSTKLVRTNDVIVIENLTLQKMVCQKSVNDLGYGYFISRMKTKCEDYGRVLIEADKWFASTKRCHVCGYKNKELTLEQRSWECPVCKTFHERDVNAGKNLRLYGEKVLGIISPVELPGRACENRNVSNAYP